MRKVIIYYFHTCQYFYYRIKKTPSLFIFLVISFFTQPFIGFHFTGFWWGAVLYPIGNFLFLSITGVLIFHFSKDKQKELPVFRCPKIQLFLITLVVLFHIFLLFGQFPDPRVANNPITIFFLQNISTYYSVITKPLLSFFENFNLTDYTIKQIDIGFGNMIICVLLPLFLLLPFSRKKEEYFLHRFNWKLLLLLFSLYIPFFFIGGRNIEMILLYFAFISFQAPVPEEFLYRALLQGRLESFVTNKLNAIVITALIFGFMHLPINSEMYS